MKKLLLTVLLALGVAGFSANAQATSYGISYNNIFDAEILFSDFANTTILSSSNTTSAAATLNPPNVNASDSVTDAAGGPVNVLVQNAPGSVPLAVDNAFFALGQTGNPNYAYADAAIPSVQTVDAQGNVVTRIQATNIAESNLNTAATSSGTASNTSSTDFRLQFVLQTPDILTFNAKAAPYLQTLVGPLGALGTQSTAFINATLNITDAQGNEIFNFSPNGLVTAIVGGTELFDDFTLNTNRNQQTPGVKTYDPTGAGAPVGIVNPASFGRFSAQTNPGLLVAGEVYTLTLSMVEGINLTLVPVPEPGTLVLLGAGLVGLAVLRRRKSGAN